MPKVSVIIPIYGVEDYIERCAISLFEQTLDDIEYIFVNDCTPDSSIEKLNNIIKKYPNRQPYIKIISHKQNKGLPQARKTGIINAIGDYIVHCDSDDWVDTNAYEILYNKANVNQTDILFFDYFISNGEKHTVTHRKEIDKTKPITSCINNLLWPVWGAFIRKDLYLNNNITYPVSNNGEDIALMLQLVYYANIMDHIQNPLYYYFINENSLSKNQQTNIIIERLNQIVVNTELIFDFFAREGLSDNLKNDILTLKLYCRTKISNLTSNSIYRKLWYSIYPEIENTSFTFNKFIPIKLKINYWTVRTGTYRVFKRIQNFLFK